MITLQKQTGSKLLRVISTFLKQPTHVAYFSEMPDPSDLKSCWFCSKKNPSSKHNCGTCEMAQQPERTIKDMNYFEIFKSSIKFDIDKKQLEREYRKLQMQLHPDKYSVSVDNSFECAEEARQYSEKLSSLINQAFAVLSEDFKRAEYILKLKKKLREEDRTIMDSDFLVEIFEKRDRVQETEDKEELEKLKVENDTNLKESYTELAKLLSKGEFDEAADLLEKLKYFHSIENAIAEREDKEKHSVA